MDFQKITDIDIKLNKDFGDAPEPSYVLEYLHSLFEDEILHRLLKKYNNAHISIESDIASGHNVMVFGCSKEECFKHESFISDIINECITDSYDSDIETKLTPDVIKKMILNEFDYSNSPIISIKFSGADFSYIYIDKNDVWTLDNDQHDIFDDQWQHTTFEEAACSFLSKINKDFKLITQKEAAQIAKVTISAINNSIKSRRLKSYKDDNKILVSESEVKKLYNI